MENISKLDPKKAIVSFRNFLGQDLENVISQTMVIAEPHVVMVQAPRFCSHHNERAFTKALVEIAGVRYPVDIIANFYAGTIAITSDVFGVLVKYDFENGKIINVEPYPPTPEILKGYCFGIKDIAW